MIIDTRPKSKASAEPRETRRPHHRWHAVTIVAPSSACGAALGCKGKRYLSSEAPRLPLADCDAARCVCKYRHFADRRDAPRRAEDSGAPADPRVAVNRREKRGRRASD
jgi:hypothetical protein